MQTPQTPQPGEMYLPASIVDEAIEYIDYLPEGKVTPEIAHIWRILDQHATVRDTLANLCKEL